MLNEILVVGTFWFWVLVTVEVVLLFSSVVYEKIGLAWTSIIIFSTLLWLFGDFNLVLFIIKNPVMSSACFAGYAILGSGWSIIKWYLFNGEIRESYDRIRDKFLLDNNISGNTIPPELKTSWREKLSNKDNWTQANNSWHTYVPKSYSVRKAEDIAPQLSDFRATIVFWISFWPVSMLWSILHNFIEKFFNMIYNRLRAVYASISRKTFAGIDRDLEVVNPPVEPSPPIMDNRRRQTLPGEWEQEIR